MNGRTGTDLVESPVPVKIGIMLSDLRWKDRPASLTCVLFQDLQLRQYGEEHGS